jgi:predicted AAA+ superfamily ATPase
MLERRHAPALRRLLRSFPVVTILGPRQCGKTTFVRAALPAWTYLDLERRNVAAAFEADPDGRLSQLGGRLVLDEAQRCPPVFPALRAAVDEVVARKGRFVLLGSASPSLVRGISESLAGRTAFLDLTPLRFDEVVSVEPDLGALWFRGGYPVPFLEKDDRTRSEWYEAYVRAFVERDLPSLGVDVSASTMRKLWTMVAHVGGGIWNASQLAASLGVSYHTVERYVDILEQAFLVRRLQPYAANLGKRLVKSPKIHLRDTGLLHHLLGIDRPEALDVHPARGASFETFVVDQLVSAFGRTTPGARFSFFRTATGVEADLVVEARGRVVPFEIKVKTGPDKEDAAALRRVMADLRAPRGYVVHGGADSYSLGGGVQAVAASRLLADVRRVAATVRA